MQQQEKVCHSNRSKASENDSSRPQQGGADMRNLYRDKAARETSISDICIKPQAKYMLYWLKTVQEKTLKAQRMQLFDCLFVCYQEAAAAASLWTGTWMMHLGKQGWIHRPARGGSEQHNRVDLNIKPAENLKSTVWGLFSEVSIQVRETLMFITHLKAMNKTYGDNFDFSRVGQRNKFVLMVAPKERPR